MKEITFLKFAPNCYFSTASRDKREISVAGELGAKISILFLNSSISDRDRAEHPDWTFLSNPIEELHGEELGRVKTWVLFRLQRLQAMLLLRRMKPDIISCENINALQLADWAYLGVPKGKRPRLVYDCHEFEIGQDAHRTKEETRRVMLRERRLMKKCAFTILVNDTIAGEVERIQHPDTPVIVVRSTPERWTPDADGIAAARRDYLAALELPEDTFLLMYHGLLCPGRGIETMLKAAAGQDCTAAVVIGNGDAAYLEELRRLARELGMGKKVFFHGAMPHSELFCYVAAADAGTVLLSPTEPNNVYTLPNKFFECIQSMTPVIVSDYPEVGKLTKDYDIGLVVPPDDPEAVGRAVARLREDRALYGRLKENLKAAKEDLCWEKEKKILQEAYGKVMEELN